MKIFLHLWITKQTSLSVFHNFESSRHPSIKKPVRLKQNDPILILPQKWKKENQKNVDCHQIDTHSFWGLAIFVHKEIIVKEIWLVIKFSAEVYKTSYDW